jgi:hypothetical protein
MYVIVVQIMCMYILAPFNNEDKSNMQDAILSYLIQDANLIYLTCRVGQWLIAEAEPEKQIRRGRDKGNTWK